MSAVPVVSLSTAHTPPGMMPWIPTPASPSKSEIISLIIAVAGMPVDVQSATVLAPPCPDPLAPVLTPAPAVPVLSDPDAPPVVVVTPLPPAPVLVLAGGSYEVPPHARIPAPQPRAMQKPITREDSILVMVLASLSVALHRSGTCLLCRTPTGPSLKKQRPAAGAFLFEGIGRPTT